MRRQFLGALLFAGTLAFTACQNETVIYLDENGNPIENVELKEGEGLLKINLSNTSANSRAARPVGSSAAANNVNTVKVYVYSKTQEGDDFTYDDQIRLKENQTNIELANAIITIKNYSGEDDHNNSSLENHDIANIKLTGITAGRIYKFVAVGYNAESAGGANPYGEASFNNFVASTTVDKTGYGVEELFAGVSKEIAATTKGNFLEIPTVVIERQVAGMLGYFTNVPTRIDDKVVKYVKVYANQTFTKFSYPSESSFNGLNSSELEQELLSFDLTKIATNYNDGNPTGTSYTFADCSSGLSAESTSETSVNGNIAPLAENYKAPEGLKLVQNSIFGGCYIIPYSTHYNEQTLTVELLGGENGKEVLKTLNVVTDKVPNGDTPEATKYAYDIRRNNFYSIGQKLYTGSTDGKDPDNEDPDPDPEKPDTPVDLGGSTEIVVQINDAWDVLHEMGVEE